MAMDATDLEELAAQLKMTRKAQMNFGLCIASKAEDCALVIDRKKKPEILEKQARKLGGSAKTVSGTVEGKGKLVMLTCFGDPPPGTVKRLKQFLKFATGEPMKVQLLDTSGSLLEGDSDDEPENGPGAPQEAAPEGAGPASDFGTKLLAGLKKMVPQIQTALTQNPAVKEPVQKLIAAIRTAAAENNEAEGLKRLKQLSEVLAKLAARQAAAEPPAPETPAPEDAAPENTEPDDPKAAEWASEHARLAPLIEQALTRQQVKDDSGLRASWALAIERAENELFTDALAILPRIERLLADKREDGDLDPYGSPTGLVEYVKIQFEWAQRKDIMRARLKELEAVMMSDEDIAENTDRPSAVANLDAILSRFNAGLSDAMEKLEDTPDAKTRGTLARQCTTIAQEYLDYLNNDPLPAHVRDNPFDVDADAQAILALPLEMVIVQLREMAS